ncbi:sensor domain-containing diguanylate cyclase [Alteromonas oceanisediminis]|uniref:sensor domain-containing diguanylate cyclase n=1 Tax=Alteromonas oceanisediminis TaxID=2836180 RepID=UPI001BDA2736|nr:EAL domain-containing protein [Alteromonas oceanisediminis]MBT0586770.1 EAL domain-containing protein [Alteromonas oceanisediminis]
MSTDTSKVELSEEELRELIPQLQQLTEQYKRAERVQKALFDISELSSSVSDLNSLYRSIHEIVGDFMNADNFFVAFYERDEGMIDFVYFVDEFDEQTVKQIPAEELSGGITGFILRSGEHLQFGRHNAKEVLEPKGIKVMGSLPVDFIGVPLKRGNQVIGAMVVQTYDESVRYSAENLEVLSFVSQHIVTTVDRVKSRELTERTIRERTKQLRKMNDELQDEILERQKVESLQQALFEISEVAANLDDDMDSFYVNLHSILSRLISSPNCYVAILDESKEHLKFPYFSDEESEAPSQRPLGYGLTELVLRTGQAELVNPSRVVELVESGELDVTVAQNMLTKSNSWLGSPLVVEGEISGVIAVQTYGKSNKYTSRDLELLRYVSHHIAVAMERKRQSEAIQDYTQQLSQRVEARTAELNRANDILKKQIDQRKEIELKLIHDAHHDELTDLPNRTMFTSRLELALANKRRHPSNNFAVLFIDLDRFKVINDTLGHHAGDQFLIEVARRIGTCIRGHDLLARLGGDEFVILLDNFDSLSDVEEVAGRVIDSVAEPFLLEQKEMYSGASIGIAHLDITYQTADEIVRDADAAMYQAKQQGRGRYVMFDKSMRERLLEELELENEFRRALRESEFECYVQPSVSLESKTPMYFECYVRWEHPTLGKVKREQFWQIAEQSGLTLELDNYMLEQACAQIKRWEQSEGPEKDYKIAINMSINHVIQGNLVTRLLEFIEAQGVSSEKLVFEFDENDLNRRSQFILPAIKKLRRAGISLVLDNFGSGLASLSYLFSYPFDYVKVDHRFVKSLPRSQRNQKLIQSIMLISEHLRFSVIAEGVETEQQFNTLEDLGCKFGQGKFLWPSEKLQITSTIG